MGIKHLKADSKIEHILEVLDQDAGLIMIMLSPVMVWKKLRMS